MSTLTGKRILVTRALAQNAELVQKLESRGAIPLIYPCLEIVFLPFELPDTQFDWVIYTSQNAVKALKNHSFKAGKIAAVGPRTLPSALTPLTYNSESLAKLFEKRPPQKILLPQGDLADNSLQEALERSGHAITRLTVYSTRKPANPVSFDFGHLDAITFTSPSAVKNFLELTQETSRLAACIGTTTYQTAKNLGFDPVICAKEHSLDGLITALEQYFLN
jgi:uroporphyrinogen III methyltransferase/synthase